MLVNILRAVLSPKVGCDLTVPSITFPYKMNEEEEETTLCLTGNYIVSIAAVS